ncbi:MAG: amino acid ABC transporter permease [Chloroflexi bacterium]|nr:amino acid ABC transporter permease [Chloroflexota bacterium]
MNTTNQILPPPTERYTILNWLRKNLFQDWNSSIVTVIGFYFVFILARGVLTWALTEAKWQVISANLRILMVGQYPVTQLWRIWICVGILGALAGLSWGIWIRQKPMATMITLGGPFLLALLPLDPANRILWVVVGLITALGFGLGRSFPKILSRTVIITWLLYLPIVMVLVAGWTGERGFIPSVPTNAWGGLLLTSLIAFVGLLLSFPIGTALAIGRISRYPLIRAFCVVYIELVRSVPLITVFFMAQTMLPLFLPDNINIDRVARAMVAFTLFSAAYMAENVRGGLQAIPKGQHEAAAALGLGSFLSLRLIILPQALRNIIPILTASAIGGFRDTSLVLIVGLLDLLGIAQVTLAQPDFLGRHIEVYAFLAVIYWTVSYIMSYIGQTIEARSSLDGTQG